ncbi:MAG: DUF882 domain-containing protein [Gammaproteobacteria bacterium]
MKLISRRRYLTTAMTLVPIVALPLLAPKFARAATIATGNDVRTLGFFHTHTSEKLDIVYSDNGHYLPDALQEINHLLRDFRSGDIHVIDPALLDMLHQVRVSTGSKARFEVISGYRSPATNAMLARTRGGVADHSLHLNGQAIDVRLPGVATQQLQRAALALNAGGVGYYPASDFVHIDTGRVRRW